MNEKGLKKTGRPDSGRHYRAGFRVDRANAEHINAQSNNPRFGNSTNYLNWLITQDRMGRDAGLQSLEARLVKTIEGLEDEMRAIRINVATDNAFLHAFTKMYLVNHPEADADTKLVARSTAKARYQRLLEQAAESLSYPEALNVGTMKSHANDEEEINGQAPQNEL